MSHWSPPTADTAITTDPRSPDPGLRGRTYAIRFEDVWQACLWLAQGGLRGCEVLRADDHQGVIDARSKRLLSARTDHLRIEIGLDENAQTRVDARSAPSDGIGGLGRPRRLVRRFQSRLDRRLKARPGQILDPTLPPPWLDSSP